MNNITTARLPALVLTQVPIAMRNLQFKSWVNTATSTIFNEFGWKGYPDEAKKMRAVNFCNGGIGGA